MYDAIINQVIDARTLVAVQEIQIPAAKTTFSRAISEKHPRRQWTFTSYAPENPFGSYHASRLEYTLDHWVDHHLHPSHSSPLIFQITDDEYKELKNTGSLPRNVTLRAMRALDAADAIVIGRGKDVEEAFLEIQGRMGTASKLSDFLDRNLQSDPNPTVRDLYTAAFNGIDTAIEMNNPAGDHYLEARTPKAARARAAGPRRRFGNTPAPQAVDETPAPAPVPVPAPAVAKGVVKIGDRITRPNGQDYIARAVEVGQKGMSDVALFDTVLSNGGSILMSGLPGTGKTASLEATAISRGSNLVTLICTPTTESGDLLGTYVPVVDPSTGRETLVWSDGPLVKAMENGDLILLDEIFLTPGSELSPLFPLMDGRGVIDQIPTNPGRGRIVAKEGFGIVAAYNPDSARHVNEALLSRFTLKIEHSTDFGLLRTLGVSDRVVDFAEHLAKLRESGEVEFAPQHREIMRFSADEKMLGTVYALQNLLSNVPVDERVIITNHAAERFGDIPQARQIIRAAKV